MRASRICCVGTCRKFSHFLRPFQWPNWMSSVSMAPKSVSKLKPRISSWSTPISLRQSLNNPTHSLKFPILSVETAMKSVAPNVAYFFRCSECEPNALQLRVMLYRVRLFNVIRPDAGGEAVDVLVRQVGDLINVVECEGGQHRPEDLFLGDGH